VSRPQRAGAARLAPSARTTTPPGRQQIPDTGRLCHYADDPVTRPCCQLTAVVRRGSTPLCAACDALRSTLGKGQPATRLPAGPPVDPLEWITPALARLHAAEADLAAAATRARQHGHSWAAIGARLDITRQAAQQRFGPPGPRPRELKPMT
jgi:hypothetical protein